jgi:poly(3-hydroxybutyrate) depolymerase
MNRFLLAGILTAAIGVTFLTRAGNAQDAAGWAATVDIHRDIEYASVNGFSLKLDLYIPKAAAKPMPLFIWIHGGSSLPARARRRLWHRSQSDRCRGRVGRRPSRGSARHNGRPPGTRGR